MADSNECSDLQIIWLYDILSQLSRISKLSDKEIEEILDLSNTDDSYINQLEKSCRLQSQLERLIRDSIQKERKKQTGFEKLLPYMYLDMPTLNPEGALSAPNVQYVSQTFLNYLAGNPRYGRVLGVYDTNTDTIYILNTLYGREHDKVLYHETMHRRYPHASETEVRRMTAAAGYI